MASISAASRSCLLPRLARNRLLYLPEKAEPVRSSSRLELRTMSGRSAKSSRATDSPLTISGGKCEFLNTWTMDGYSCRIWPGSMYFQLYTSSRLL